MGHDRRSFIKHASLGTIALGGGSVAAERSTGQDGAITPTTIAEAEKLHGLVFTGPERERLAQSMPGQVAAVKAIRALDKPYALQPATTFDPRLPGVSYPPQRNVVSLSTRTPAPLPKSDADIAFASVRDQAHWIRTRQLTSARLTDIYLERIARIAPKLFCYITVTADVARRQAAESDRELAAGKYRGLLHGIPYGIKDLFDTAGIATTWGARPFRDRVPATDSAVVRKLRNAGAVLLGKLATGTLANGAEWFGGTCRNPWNPDEPAGGSSTGSGSATAAALCSFSIGTDSLGSILNPSDRCGTVGLRATFGRIPTDGAMPLSPSFDRIGPLTRRVEDAAIVLAAINGADPTSACSIDFGFRHEARIDLRRITIGYSKKWFERFGFSREASVPVSEAHHQALRTLEGLGVKLVEVELPDFPIAALFNNLFVEAASTFEDLTLDGRDEQLPDGGGFGWPDGWRRAHLMSAVDYLQADRIRRRVMTEYHRLFERCDALFGPTYGEFQLLAAMNFTGHPGLGLRAGLAESPTRDIGPSSPTGGPTHTITQNVVFHGRLFEEGKILAVAHALETALDVWRHRPPVD